ncbi:MFS transporter [Candidatus Peregrinibacteria bacterium]|nr:MFS transporter [Candidatus Peregrinibacteria bacterium]
MKKTTPILIISILNTIIKSLDMMLVFFMAIHFVNIGLSGLQIGILFGISTITALITILPSGLGSDKLKSKNLVTIAIILMALQYFGMVYSTTFLPLALLFFLGRIGKNLYKASIESLFYKTTEQEIVSEQIGVFHSLNYLGIGGITILAGYLLAIDYTFENIFLFIGIIYAITSILTFHLLPENQITKFDLLHYKNDLLKGKVLIFLLIIMLFYLHVGAEITSYSLFLKNNLALNTLQIGLYMGIAIIFMAPTVKLMAKKFAKFKGENIFFWGLFLSGAGHILMTIKNPATSFAFRAVHEIGDALTFFFLAYGITKIFESGRMGGNNSMVILISSIGTTIGSLVFGPLGENFGYDKAIFFGGVTTIIALMIAIFFKKYFNHA